MIERRRYLFWLGLLVNLALIISLSAGLWQWSSFSSCHNTFPNTLVALFVQSTSPPYKPKSQVNPFIFQSISSYNTIVFPL
jgi:DNA-binding transcriptional regulator of glucitol operon